MTLFFVISAVFISGFIGFTIGYYQYINLHAPSLKFLNSLIQINNRSDLDQLLLDGYRLRKIRALYEDLCGMGTYKVTVHSKNMSDEELEFILKEILDLVKEEMYLSGI